MTCSGCEMAINEALEKNDGIFRSEANHFNANVKVHYDPKKVRPVDMVNTINELGYQADLFMQNHKDLKPVERKSTEALQGHDKLGKAVSREIQEDVQSIREKAVGQSCLLCAIGL